jgi:hypothetical protein
MIRAARLRLVLPIVAVTAVLLVCAVCQAGSTITVPLGIYCVGPDQLSAIGNTRFNLVVNPFWAQGTESSLRYLESCRKHGKMGTPGFDTEKIKSRDAIYLREYVRRIKDHSALFAYYLSDEPSMVGVTPEAATFAYQTIKGIDATRPVLVSHFRDARAYKPAYDVLCFDQYPIGTMPIARYRQLCRDVVGEVQPKPVWAMIQAFGAGKDWKKPTPEEQRCMTYLTIANGAQDILFYMYGRRGDSCYMGDHPEQWEFTRRLASEVDGFAAVLLAKTSSVRVVVETRHVDALLKERGDRLYLIAVN